MIFSKLSKFLVLPFFLSLVNFLVIFRFLVNSQKSKIIWSISCQSHHCNSKTRLRALTLSWLRAAREANDQLLSNMLNCGQLINNRTSDLESNVSYIEINLPRSSLKRSHLRYIPNITYTHTEQDQSIRLCGKRGPSNFFDTFQILHKSRNYEPKSSNIDWVWILW